MDHCSHIPNSLPSAKVRTSPADIAREFSHIQIMARRGIPKQINWFLREWMAACGLDGRGAQAEMMRRTGWSKATMSQLFNNRQDYSPKIIGEASLALGVAEYELLMHPDDAMAMRRLRASAQEIVSLATEPRSKTGTDDR